MSKNPKLEHVKRVTVKKRTSAGERVYVHLYFRTGQTDARGKEILAPLPPIEDPGFWTSYASFKAGRSRRTLAKAESMPELTVEQLCSLYQRSPHFTGLSAGTQKLYGISLRYLCKMLPTAPAALLERKDLVLLVDGRADQPGAANSLLRAINALFRWARERGHVENDPCRDIRELPIGEHGPWPEHILQAALAAEEDQVRLGAHLLFYTAQRIGDVVRMKRTDIRNGRIEVVQQKTKRELSIRIHAELQRELDGQPASLGYLLPGRGGRALNPEVLRKTLQDFAAGMGAKVVPHGLRKNAVNALLEAGCSAAETASISGQSLAMVEHYAKARSQTRLGDAAVLKWQGHKR